MDVEITQELQAMYDDIASLRASAARLYQKDPKGVEFDNTLNRLVDVLMDVNPPVTSKSRHSSLTAQIVFDLIREFEYDAGEGFTDQGGMPNVPVANYVEWLRLKNDPEINEWLEDEEKGFEARAWKSAPTWFDSLDWNDFLHIYNHSSTKENIDEGYERNVMLLSQFIVSCDDLVKEEFLDWIEAELARGRCHEKWYGSEGIITKMRKN